MVIALLINSVMGSTSLSLLIVRLVVSHFLMPRLANFGGGGVGAAEGGGSGGDGEPASPLAEKLLTALRVRLGIISASRLLSNHVGKSNYLLKQLPIKTITH